MIVNDMGRAARFQRLGAYGAFGSMGPLFPGLPFANDGALSLLLSGIPPQKLHDGPNGDQNGSAALPPFPSGVLDSVRQYMSDVQSKSGAGADDAHQALGAEFLSRAKNYESIMSTAPPSYDHVFGWGDSSAGQDKGFRDAATGLAKISRQFVSDYKALPIVIGGMTTTVGTAGSDINAQLAVAGAASKQAAIDAATKAATDAATNPPGMSTLEMVGIGAAALLVLGGGAYFLLKSPSKSVSGYRRRRRRRR